MSTLNSIFRGIANRINTEEQFKEIKDLIHIYDIEKDTEEDIIDIVEENLAWIATYSEEIQEFLDDFFNGSSRTSKVSLILMVVSLIVSLIVKN